MNGASIRQLRLAKGMTLQELAAQTRTTAGYLSQLERDLVDPSLSTLRKIAQALDARFPGISESTAWKKRIWSVFHYSIFYT